VEEWNRRPAGGADVVTERLLEGPPGILRGCMVVEEDHGPLHCGAVPYSPGGVYSVRGWSPSGNGPAAGILVQTTAAAVKRWRPGRRILTVEARAQDAAAPNRAGFVRCRRVRVLGELDRGLTLAMLGLSSEEPEELLAQGGRR